MAISLMVEEKNEFENCHLKYSLLTLDVRKSAAIFQAQNWPQSKIKIQYFRLMYQSIPPCMTIPPSGDPQDSHILVVPGVGFSPDCLAWGLPRRGVLTLCVRRSRKVNNAELPRPTAGEETRQKNINLFPRAYLGKQAS